MGSLVARWKALRVRRFSRRAAFACLCRGAGAYVLLRALRVWARLTRAQDGHLVPAVVLVRLDEIGDVLLTSTMLSPLRRCYPEHRIVMMTKDSCAALVETHPEVDRVVPVRTPRRMTPLRIQLWNAVRTAAGLRGRYRVDVLLHPRWDADYYGASLITAALPARVTAGYASRVAPVKFALNPGVDVVLDEVVEGPAVAHEVDRNLDVLRAVGCAVPDPAALALTLTDEDRARAEAVVFDGSGGPVVALGVGAGNPKRTWPVHRFEELVLRLRDEMDARFVVVGGGGDAAIGRALSGRFGDGVLDLCGKLSLRETAAVLGRTAVFVGADSGPVHLAAAVSVGSVVVSCHPADGSPIHENAPERFHPWGVDHVVVRPPRALPPCSGFCGENQPHCILQVPVDEVVRAAQSLLTTYRA